MEIHKAKVIKVLSKPIPALFGDQWTVRVEFDYCGRIYERTLYFDSMKEAENCNIGYMFRF